MRGDKPLRTAIVSDIHGNLTALEAVLADLERTSPDLVLHGGDLAHSGPNPVQVVDWVQCLGWRGVLGNTDEMLFRPASLTEFEAESTSPPHLFRVIAEMAQATRECCARPNLPCRDAPDSPLLYK